MKKYLKLALYIAIIIFTFLVDQITKMIVENTLVLGDSHVLIPNFLKFTYIHNTGAAFGILSGKTIYLIIFSVLVVGFILYQFYVYKNSTVISSMFALLLGGLLGNLYDRIQFNYVRDFIDFTLGKYDAPIFNFSDICICLSIILILINIYKYEGVNKDVKPIDYEGDIRKKVRSVSERDNRQNQKQRNQTHKTR